MFNDIVTRKRSKNYFIDALKGAKDPEDSRYFTEGLNLLGVYFESDYLSAGNVLADPYVEVNLEDEVGLTVEITLKPEGEHDPGIELLDLILNRTDMGVLYNDPMVSQAQQDEIDKVRGMTDYIMPKQIAIDSPDRNVTLFFSEDSVSYQKFKMLGVGYHLFTLTEEGTVGDEPYEHSLYVLLKDKESTLETFFSGLVGQKLDKSITERVLESISQTNITGMFIGGATVLTGETRTTTYGLTSTGIDFNSLEGHISIQTIDSIIQLDIGDINYSEVEPTSAGKYTYILTLKSGTEVYIYIG